MRRAALAVAFVSALAGVSGCGTEANFVDVDHVWVSRQVYGGVKWDLKSAQDLIHDGCSFKGGTGSGDLGVMALGVSLLALDLPLSALADTLTLPWTIPAALEKQDEADLAGDSTSDPRRNRSEEGSAEGDP